MKSRNIAFYLFLMLLFFVAGCEKNTTKPDPQQPVDTLFIKLLPPAGNKIYHAAFPDFGPTEDKVSKTAIIGFETLAGKPITWAYFSNNWFFEDGGIQFPRNEVKTIQKAGRIPFIRLMPRSDFTEGGPDPVYTMQKFIDGDFDPYIKQWAREAKATGIPLLAEFGTEVNGNWFPWNAQYNGKNTKTGYGSPDLYDGMERFRDAYRHIITICREQGAENITWFYHVDVNSDPTTNWNTKAGYYPGDDFIDWIGVSVYGSQTGDDEWRNFEDILGDEWDNLVAVSPGGKPIAILEWGTTDNVQHQKAGWITDAVNSIKPGGRFYPQVKAISYWHSNFDETYLRIDSSPEALTAYQQGVADTIFVWEGVLTQQ